MTHIDVQLPVTSRPGHGQGPPQSPPVHVGLGCPPLPPCGCGCGCGGDALARTSPPRVAYGGVAPSHTGSSAFFCGDFDSQRGGVLPNRWYSGLKPPECRPPSRGGRRQYLLKEGSQESASLALYFLGQIEDGLGGGGHMAEGESFMTYRYSKYGYIGEKTVFFSHLCIK